MTIYKFHIAGVTPILMHNPAGSMGAPKGAGMSRKTIPTPEVEAEAGTYRLPSGDLCMPAVGIRNSILRAATGSRIGKTSAKMVLSGAIMLMDEFVPIVDGEGDPIDEYVIDSRRAVIQRAGIIRSRPKVEPPWGIVGTFHITDGHTADGELEPIVGDGAITDALERAGQTVGIGDYRPEKNGWFGKFDVVSAGFDI